MPDLSVNIAGVKLKNPVIPASGTLDCLKHNQDIFKLNDLGAIINKTVTLYPQPGNPSPRIWETPCGMLNSIGIPSVGIQEFIEKQLPILKTLNDCLIISIAAFSIKEFSALAEIITAQNCVDFIELNLSCPNLESKIIWAADKKMLKRVISAVKRISKIPVIAKLSPNVTDISEMAALAEQAGADALSLVNTYKGMAVDLINRKPALGNITGGLSGPAIKPLALYAIYSAYKRVSIPLIGMGGISCWQDAVEYILCGAHAVAVGMYNFVDPLILIKVIKGLLQYLKENNFSALTDIIGLAHKE